MYILCQKTNITSPLYLPVGFDKSHRSLSDNFFQTVSCAVIQSVNLPQFHFTLIDRVQEGFPLHNIKIISFITFEVCAASGTKTTSSGFQT